MATLKEVAERAGVSQSTVSRLLNDSGHLANLGLCCSKTLY